MSKCRFKSRSEEKKRLKNKDCGNRSIKSSKKFIVLFSPLSFSMLVKFEGMRRQQLMDFFIRDASLFFFNG